MGRTAERSTLVITDQTDLYPVVEYLRRYTSHPIRLVGDALAFARLLSRSYSTLPGTTLEGIGKLFSENVKLYCYPVPRAVFLEGRNQDKDQRITVSSETALVSVDDLRCEPPLDHLYRYLREADWLVPLALPKT